MHIFPVQGVRKLYGGVLMKRYSIGQFAKEINVTVQTLRNWDHTGKLKPDYVSPPAIVTTLKNKWIIFSACIVPKWNKR